MWRLSEVLSENPSQSIPWLGGSWSGATVSVRQQRQSGAGGPGTSWDTAEGSHLLLGL